ncbi:MAG: hypothetical protein HY781_02785, partial [Chloroflexi bacterium]|nr:hypothetical protein [Chloroflexota bacterium]
NTGMGKDAKIKSASYNHKRYSTYDWEEEWDGLFTEENPDMNIKSAYQHLMAQFALEIGVGLNPLKDIKTSVKRQKKIRRQL